MDPTRLTKHARRLRAMKVLSHAHCSVLDTLLWRCRAPGSPSCQVSLDRLAALSGAARSTVALAIDRLVALGLITRLKTYVTVGWRRLQGRNIYVFRTESDWRTTNREPVRKKRPTSIGTLPIEPKIDRQVAAKALEAARNRPQLLQALLK